MLAKENSMNRKIVMAGLAALTVAATTAPALAQGVARSSWGGPGFGVGVGFGDSGWNDYGYYREPGVGVSVGFGSPGWGYDDWNYSSYAAAPGYGCSCANRYRTARIAPRYRSSSYAWGGYPNDYAYADDNYYGGYYGGGYASANFGWTDDSWGGRRTWRDGDRRFDRFGRGDRVRADVSIGGREMRGSRMNRTAFTERTSGEARVTRGSGEFLGGTSGEIRARGSVESRGGASGEIRGTVGRGGGAAMRAGSSSGGRRGGDETR
jgi:hypothetical protein